MAESSPPRALAWVTAPLCSIMCLSLPRGSDVSVPYLKGTRPLRESKFGQKQRYHVPIRELPPAQSRGETWGRAWETQLFTGMTGHGGDVFVGFVPVQQLDAAAIGLHLKC
ncbi:Hypothetical predicted protein [Marmota monax]|uniref:Uncharacterized protein n=1 Tax=Marmota monax TaxID=9995 RepID=A0A5E4CQ02_MARMO|nr:Hypothetical predicted protein [Marmota monax]